MTDLEAKRTSGKNNKKTQIYYLILIIGISLAVRLFYFQQYPIGFSDDAMVYFWYANDIKILDQLPNYLLSNIGWSIFLSFFFEVFNFNINIFHGLSFIKLV